MGSVMTALMSECPDKGARPRCTNGIRLTAVAVQDRFDMLEVLRHLLIRLLPRIAHNQR